jgi:hypothetical protein
MVSFSKFIDGQRGTQFLLDTDGFLYSRRKDRDTPPVLPRDARSTGRRSVPLQKAAMNALRSVFKQFNLKARGFLGFCSSG